MTKMYFMYILNIIISISAWTSRFLELHITTIIQ
jgi:hypothetical protein